jgi:hypothetical protein
VGGGGQFDGHILPSVGSVTTQSLGLKYVTVP